MVKFSEQVFLVTGGASGIGAAVAEHCRNEGATVVIADLDMAKAAETAEQLGAGCDARQIDVTDEVQVEQLMSDLYQRYGRLDMLCNCAGIGSAEGLLHEIPTGVYDRVMAVNHKGAWLCMKYALPFLMKDGGGSIVNMSSALAHLSLKQGSVYCSGKAGLVHMTHVAALEYAEFGVRVNAVCPGIVATPLTLDNPEMEEAMTPEQLDQMVAASHPLGRAARPEDVAAVVAFLASDDAAFVTGESINVDGGWSVNARSMSG